MYGTYTACNGIPPGSGYTYPLHPDAFPSALAGYTDPMAFIAARLPKSVTQPSATPTVAPSQGASFWDLVSLNCPSPADGSGRRDC